jgi:hypothetical protein
MRPGTTARRARQERARLRVQTERQPERLIPGVPDNPGEVLRLAKKLGWEAAPVKDGWRLLHPGGASVTLHKTISDTKAWLSIRAALLRGTRTESKETA